MRRTKKLSLLPLCSAVALVCSCGDNITDPDALSGPAIGGTVWHDVNGNNVIDPGERPRAGVEIYLDLNRNEILDPGEPVAESDAAGAYAFRDLVPGEYAVRQQMTFGWRSVFETNRVPYIIGGADASAMEFPFIASVGIIFDFGDGTELFSTCGGALVSDRFVVTAAHCSEGIDPNNAGVLLGTNDLDGDDGQLVLVSAITIHPQYSGDTEEGFDIAVWQLAERLDLEGRGLATVTMLGSPDAALAGPGELATTVGWGVSDSSSELLQKVHVPLLSREVCEAAYPRVASLETQLCAGATLGGVDSCQGDSGGPLLVRLGDQWLHAGVTSWGDGCADPNSPGVYAETGALYAWATDTMLETSRVFRVTVESQPVFVNFGSQSTLHPTSTATTPRWQLTNVVVDGAADGIVAADTALAFSFDIIDEGGPRGFDCSFDPDAQGALPAQAVPCSGGAGSAVGNNQLQFPGYSNGAYRAELTVSTGGESFTRSPLIIAGTPSQDVAAGTLEAGDQLDPDFNDPYFIDYYEITGATPGLLTLVDLETSSFRPFFVLYDGDVRTAAGGGTLAISQSRLEVFPEAGKRYLIGVSTFGSGEAGPYTATLLNNGTLTPITL